LVIFHQVDAQGNAQPRVVAWRVSKPTNQLAFEHSSAVTEPASRVDRRNHLDSNPFSQFTEPYRRKKTLSMFIIGSDPKLKPSGITNYAIWNPTNNQLSVHAEDIPSGPYALPNNREAKKPVVRACALPLTIALDTTLVGALVALELMAGMHGAPMAMPQCH
jgi:hypothetical protein